MRVSALLCLSPALLLRALMPVPAIAIALEQQPPPAQNQPAASQDPASPADAARKSTAEKDKPKARRVYTDEDMSSLTAPVSVVGEEKSEPASAKAQEPSAKPRAAEAKPAVKDEVYWRGRYQRLRQQMDAADKQIADKQEEIKKYGHGGTSTDLSKLSCGPPPSERANPCVLPEIDRGSQLKDLEKKKADLEKQMNELQEEARKAGADPGWLR